MTPARPKALVLSMHDLNRWADTAELQQAPGGSMPYGMQRLEHDFELSWTDRQHTGAWAGRLPRYAAGAARRWAPGWQGTLGALHSRPLLRDDPEVVFSIFENAGLGLARVQGWSRRAVPVPHVMLACWLAEDCLAMDERARRSLRRSLRSVDRLLVFSTNQVAILHDQLSVDPERIAVVPFGIDTARYAAAGLDGPGGGGGVVAIGSDSRRDYATLFDAVRLTGLPLTLACQPRNLEGLTVPAGVVVRHDAFDDEYRRLLLSADLVVTPTVAPAYPSGQSVVLEAMAMGRATLTTDSPAMRDYVEEGVTGFLTPPRSAGSMARRMGELLADPGLRDRTGAEAAHQVRRRFGLDQMWDAVATQMHRALRTTATRPASRHR